MKFKFNKLEFGILSFFIFVFLIVSIGHASTIAEINNQLKNLGFTINPAASGAKPILSNGVPTDYVVVQKGSDDYGIYKISNSKSSNVIPNYNLLSASSSGDLVSYNGDVTAPLDLSRVQSYAGKNLVEVGNTLYEVPRLSSTAVGSQRPSLPAPAVAKSKSFNFVDPLTHKDLTFIDNGNSYRLIDDSTNQDLNFIDKTDTEIHFVDTVTNQKVTFVSEDPSLDTWSFIDPASNTHISFMDQSYQQSSPVETIQFTDTSVNKEYTFVQDNNNVKFIDNSANTEFTFLDKSGNEIHFLDPITNTRITVFSDGAQSKKWSLFSSDNNVPISGINVPNSKTPKKSVVVNADKSKNNLRNLNVNEGTSESTKGTQPLKEGKTLDALTNPGININKDGEILGLVSGQDVQTSTGFKIGPLGALIISDQKKAEEYKIKNPELYTALITQSQAVSTAIGAAGGFGLIPVGQEKYQKTAQDFIKYMGQQGFKVTIGEEQTEDGKTQTIFKLDGVETPIAYIQPGKNLVQTNRNYQYNVLGSRANLDAQIADLSARIALKRAEDKPEAAQEIVELQIKLNNLRNLQEDNNDKIASEIVRFTMSRNPEMLSEIDPAISRSFIFDSLRSGNANTIALMNVALTANSKEDIINYKKTLEQKGIKLSKEQQDILDNNFVIVSNLKKDKKEFVNKDNMIAEGKLRYYHEVGDYKAIVDAIQGNEFVVTKDDGTVVRMSLEGRDSFLQSVVTDIFNSYQPNAGQKAQPILELLKKKGTNPEIIKQVQYAVDRMNTLQYKLIESAQAVPGAKLLAKFGLKINLFNGLLKSEIGEFITGDWESLICAKHIKKAKSQGSVMSNSGLVTAHIEGTRKVIYDLMPCQTNDDCAEQGAVCKEALGFAESVNSTCISSDGEPIYDTQYIYMITWYATPQDKDAGNYQVYTNYDGQEFILKSGQYSAKSTIINDNGKPLQFPLSGAISEVCFRTDDGKLQICNNIVDISEISPSGRAEKPKNTVTTKKGIKGLEGLSGEEQTSIQALNDKFGK